MPFPTQHFVMFNMLYCKEINETFLNLSFDGGLKLCFFDWGGGVDSIHLFLLMKTIEKVDFWIFFAWKNIANFLTSGLSTDLVSPRPYP